MNFIVGDPLGDSYMCSIMCICRLSVNGRVKSLQGGGWVKWEWKWWSKFRNGR